MEMLTNFAHKQGLAIFDYYISDRIGEKNFNRPAFQKTIKDINDKKFNCLITRDLSRLGRNYIETGMYMEMFFPENDVRYIAVLENVDIGNSAHSNTDTYIFYFNYKEQI